MATLRLCTPVLVRLAGAIVLAATGCKSSDAEDVDLGNAVAAPYTVHVVQEGPFAPGTMTKYAIQTAGGPGKPDTVECWYGLDASGSHATCSYDDSDGDWDCLVTTPLAPKPEEKLWFAITFAGTAADGSVAPQP